MLGLRDIGIHCDGSGEAEIEQLGGALSRDHHVAGLQVAVKNARSMCLLETFSNLPRDAKDFLLQYSKPTATADPIGQHLSLERTPAPGSRRQRRRSGRCGDD